MKATKTTTQKKNLKNNNVVAVLDEVKVTAMAVIQKPKMPIIVPQTAATEIRTETEAQPPVTVKIPLAASTEEKDLDITTVFPNMYTPRKTLDKTSMQELADSIREVGILHVKRCDHARKAQVTRLFTVNVVIGHRYLSERIRLKRSSIPPLRTKKRKICQSRKTYSRKRCAPPKKRQHSR